MDILFSFNNLHILVNKRSIIHGVDLTISKGSTHALLGPNGSGKSTLVNAIAGHPAYTISKGSIFICGEDISSFSPDLRARRGIFTTFQQVPNISGVTVFSFLKEAYRAINGSGINNIKFRSVLTEYADLLNIDDSAFERQLNKGFSGGEKKRIEILQLLLFNPHVAILDEIDSGVDVDSRKIIVKGIEHARHNNPFMSIIFVTHYQDLIEQVRPDHVHVMKEGRIVKSGGCELAYQVVNNGYCGL